MALSAFLVKSLAKRSLKPERNATALITSTSRLSFPKSIGTIPALIRQNINTANEVPITGLNKPVKK
ncbi:hypothetical protein D3C85_1915060 [compost metagenome]